jgi:tetratricopeptide (TPR) repeat protein
MSRLKTFFVKNSLEIALLIVLLSNSASFLDTTQAPKFFLWSLLCLLMLLSIQGKKLFSSIKNSRPLLFLLAYLLVAAVSLTYSSSWEQGIYDWLKAFLFFLFSCLLVTHFSDRSLEKLSRLTLLASIFQWFILLSIAQDFLVSPTLEDGFDRAGSLMANANLCSQVLFLSLPFTLSRLFDRGTTRWGWFIHAGSFLSIMAIALLSSQAVWLAILVLLVAAFILHLVYKRTKEKLEKRRTYLLSGLFGLFLIGCISFPFFYGQLLPTSSRWESLQLRNELWNRTELLIEEHIWGGTGLGTWRIANLDYVHPDRDANQSALLLSMYSYKGDTFYERPHHDFLWVWSESGLFTLLLYGSFFVFIFFSGVSASFKSKGPKYFLFLLLTASLPAYVCIASFSYPKERIEQNIFLALIAAILIAFSSNSHRHSATKVKFYFPLKFLFLTIATLAIVLATYRMKGELSVIPMLRAKKQAQWKEVEMYALNAQNPFYKMAANGTPLHWYAGLAAFSRQEVEKAHEYFLEAYKIHPKHLHVLNNLATTYTIQGETDTAMALYQEAVKLNPNFQDARLNLSALYYNKGNIEQAWETIKAVPTSSQHPQFITFANAILEAKYREVFLDIARNNNLEDKTLLFLKSDKKLFFILYRRATQEDQPIEAVFKSALDSFIEKRFPDPLSSQRQ